MLLKNNIIFGAGLDVFEKEPISKPILLIKNKKSFNEAHTLYFYKECTSRMSVETVQNIIDFLRIKLKNL